MYYKQEFGHEGEEEATNYLVDIGYTILQRNYSCNIGEIDIIAYDSKKDELVFIEVKSRQQIKYGRPCEAVDKRKIKHIYKVAEYYIYTNNIENRKFRFDVIEILSFPNEPLSLNHIIQAFDY